VRIASKDLARRLKKDERRAFKGVEKARSRALQRARGTMVERSPVDQGQLRAAWRVDGESLVNDAPHSGIVEMGARPHGVSAEGMQALKDWARRHGAKDDEEAEAIAWGIARKLRAHGQEPTFFVRDAMPELREQWRQEVVRMLRSL